MASPNLSSVLNFFQSKPSEEEQNELAQEVMLMVLARATSADTNFKDVEIEKVREVLKDHLNVDYEAADVRVAANSELYMNTSLKKYLSYRAIKMRTADKVETVQALAEVINVDGRVSSLEIDFFNDVAEALALTPAEIMGLNQEVSVRGS